MNDPRHRGLLNGARLNMHFRHDSSSVNVRAIATLVLAAAALTGCADAPAGLDPSARGAITEASNISSRDLGSDGPGAVYALTNAGAEARALSLFTLRASSVAVDTSLGSAPASPSCRS